MRHSVKPRARKRRAVNFCSPFCHSVHSPASGAMLTGVGARPNRNMVPDLSSIICWTRLWQHRPKVYTRVSQRNRRKGPSSCLQPVLLGCKIFVSYPAQCLLYTSSTFFPVSSEFVLSMTPEFKLISYLRIQLTKKGCKSLNLCCS